MPFIAPWVLKFCVFLNSFLFWCIVIAVLDLNVLPQHGHFTTVEYTLFLSHSNRFDAKGLSVYIDYIALLRCGTVGFNMSSSSAELIAPSTELCR